jgi:hypothetical protein
MIMSASYSYTPAELDALEKQTGLRLLCYLDPGDGGPLLPVLGKAGQALDDEERCQLARRLSGQAQLVEVERRVG